MSRECPQPRAGGGGRGGGGAGVRTRSAIYKDDGVKVFLSRLRVKEARGATRTFLADEELWENEVGSRWRHRHGMVAAVVPATTAARRATCPASAHSRALAAVAAVAVVAAAAAVVDSQTALALVVTYVRSLSLLPDPKTIRGRDLGSGPYSESATV